MPLRKNDCSLPFDVFLSNIFFFSLRFLPLADALLYVNTAPLFVPLVIWIVYRVPTPLYVWLSILLGFVGVGLSLQIHHKFTNPAAFLALLAGLFVAIIFVKIRRLSKEVSSYAITFYTFFLHDSRSSFYAVWVEIF